MASSTRYGYSPVENGAIIGSLGTPVAADRRQVDLAEDEVDGVGLALSAPGGLFEITLGVLLVVRGFPAPDSTVTAGAWDRVA